MSRPTPRERAASTSLTLDELGAASMGRSCFEATREQERVRLAKVEREIEAVEESARDDVRRHVVFTVRKAEDARFASLMGVRPTKECESCTDETRAEGGCLSCGDTRLLPREPDEIVMAGLAPLKRALQRLASALSENLDLASDAALADDFDQAREVLRDVSSRES